MNAILVVPTITFAKLSVLCLFYRIFVTQAFRRWVIIAGVICILWCISSVMAIIFRCNPINAAWNLFASGKCYDFALFVVIIETFNCLQDFIIVFMPLSVIRHLQMPRRQKISITLIFLLGGFVIITSIVRIVYTWHPQDPQSAFLNTGKWALLQLSSAIVCACLPTYKALIPQRLKPLDRLLTRWKPLGFWVAGSSSDPTSQVASPTSPIRPRAFGYNDLELEVYGKRTLANKAFPSETSTPQTMVQNSGLGS